MISLDLRDSNHLMVLSSPNKTPIISSMGLSMSYYNSMELLCITYASCFGKHLHQYCRYNNLNPETFENINVDMDNFKLILNIKHPKLTEEQKKDIISLSTNCDIYKNFLKCEIIVNMIENEKQIKEILENKTRRTCCGG